MACLRLLGGLTLLPFLLSSTLQDCFAAIAPPSHFRNSKRHKLQHKGSLPSSLLGHHEVTFDREDTLGGYHSGGVPLSDSLVALGSWLDARQRGETLRYDRMGPVGFWLLEQVEPKPRLLSSAQPWWGKVFGASKAPTIEAYVSKGDPELQWLCEDSDVRLPVERLPLRLPAHIYQQLFLSQETCDHRHLAAGMWDVANEKDDKHWATICRTLPPRMEDVLPTQKRHESCAVVGNAGNLMASTHGKEIDGHEAVFRLNKAPTEGFETHVGSNTTYRFINNDQFSVYVAEGYDSETGEMERIPQDMGETILLSYAAPDQMARELPLVTRREPDKKFTTVSFYLARHSNFVLNQFRQCINHRPGNKYRKSKATSGVKAVLLALHLCKRVTVYGIGDTSPASDTIPYQYFALGGGNWTSRESVSGIHSLSLEEHFVQALAHADILRHCQHSGCTHSPPPSVRTDL